MVVVYIFETYLQIRQHRALKLPTLPKPLLGVISDEKFKRSRDYTIHRRFIQCCHTFFCNLHFKNIFLPPKFTSWLIHLDYQIVNIFASSYSYFHFVYKAGTILMHIAILYFRVLPWFWKVNESLASINIVMQVFWLIISFCRNLDK